MRTLLRCREGDDWLLAFRPALPDIVPPAIPGRDLMAPPDLPGDAPILNLLHPAEIIVGPSLGNEPDLAVAHRLNRRMGQRMARGIDADKPLRREVGFHDRPAAVTGAERVRMLFHLQQMAAFP